jgi:predicted unusual protein kinase regulating ubiquinone biosynthesis (AarF/ABC1/UbiB family)
MTFVPGQTMTDFEKHYNKKIRSYVARIGASAFFEMLFQHNFVHVDCHGGNIMVKINKDYSIWT